MSYSLGKILEEYVQYQVKNGPFNNASEVIRDALRLHQSHYMELERWQRDLDEEKRKEQSLKTEKTRNTVRK